MEIVMLSSAPDGNIPVRAQRFPLLSGEDTAPQKAAPCSVTARRAARLPAALNPAAERAARGQHTRGLQRSGAVMID